ncbi:MAG: CDP-archaeol synthase [Alphaproteobacteria bacterium]
MEPGAISYLLKLLLLLATANGAPVLAKKIWGGVLGQPLDAGLRFPDGRPVFGPTKTVRGVLIAVAATTAVAPLVGIAWWIGALIGVTAMAGDLFSSFVKRRLNRPPSSRALGLDHIPESLVPLLACRGLLGLTAAEIGIVVGAFFAGAVVLSRVLYRVGLRDEPH